MTRNMNPVSVIWQNGKTKPFREQAVRNSYQNFKRQNEVNWDKHNFHTMFGLVRTHKSKDEQRPKKKRCVSTSVEKH